MLAVPSPCDVRSYQILLCTEKTTRTNYRKRCTAALQTAQKRPEPLLTAASGVMMTTRARTLLAGIWNNAAFPASVPSTANIGFSCFIIASNAGFYNRSPTNHNLNSCSMAQNWGLNFPHKERKSHVTKLCELADTNGLYSRILKIGT